jgi:hypothetical protein
VFPKQAAPGDRIHTAMQWVQPAHPDSMIDRPVMETKL